MDLKRWLAVSAGADTVRLVPVSAPSAGPDVFCKLADVEAEIAELRKDAERYRALRAAHAQELCVALYGQDTPFDVPANWSREIDEWVDAELACAPTVSAG
jgi:hypothetical protein